MKTRMDYFKVDPDAMKGMLNLEKYIHGSGLEEKLVHLIKFRASQINGCGHCLDMHSKDARKVGETEQRLYCLNAWREAPFYTDRERAALEWTEALTLIAENHVSDELYETVRNEFDEKELLSITMVIVAINGWNRLAIPFHSEVGNYEPK